MTVVAVVAVVAVVLAVMLITGRCLSWLATRVDRADTRTERTWAALDAALVRRARRALDTATAPGVDPATALLVADAAATALVVGLDPADRERAESGLSQVLQGVALPGIEREHARAALARRLHNEAVVSARTLRSRRAVRLFGLAGRAAAPRGFEMAEGGP